MMKSMSAPGWLWGIVATAIALSITPGVAAAQEAAEDTAALRVGIATNYAPLAFAENGHIAGVEADFAQKLPAELGVKVTIVEIPWEEMIRALQDRRIDVIMSGMSITDERSELVSFTDPYLQVGQMALIRKKDRIRFDDPAAMRAEGVRVGVHANTTSEQFARAKLKGAKVVPYASIEEAIADLRKGDLDFVIHDAPTIWRVVGRPKHEDPDLTGLYQPLTEEYLAWAVRKDDEALRQRLNGVLRRWKETKQIDTVLDKWITVRKETISVKPHE